MCWREQWGVVERSDADDRLLMPWTLDSRVFLQKNMKNITKKQVIMILNILMGM